MTIGQFAVLSATPNTIKVYKNGLTNAVSLANVTPVPYNAEAIMEPPETSICRTKISAESKAKREETMFV